ncbi:MAG: hypothetical protein IJC93_04590 [Clostridia bacterium]|nr:hypothetical protein [Clostridia bacterium]
MRLQLNYLDWDNSGVAIPCTACRYCVSETKCPMDIMIPDYFAMYNEKKRYNTITSGVYYANLTMHHGKASAAANVNRTARSICRSAST